MSDISVSLTQMSVAVCVKHLWQFDSNVSGSLCETSVAACVRHWQQYM